MTVLPEPPRPKRVQLVVAPFWRDYVRFRDAAPDDTECRYVYDSQQMRDCPTGTEVILMEGWERNKSRSEQSAILGFVSHYVNKAREAKWR